MHTHTFIPNQIVWVGGARQQVGTFHVGSIAQEGFDSWRPWHSGISTHVHCFAKRDWLEGWWGQHLSLPSHNRDGNSFLPASCDSSGMSVQLSLCLVALQAARGCFGSLQTSQRWKQKEKPIYSPPNCTGEQQLLSIQGP